MPCHRFDWGNENNEFLTRVLLPRFVPDSTYNSCVVTSSFFPCVLFASVWSDHTLVLTEPQLLWREYVFFLSDRFYVHKIDDQSIEFHNFFRYRWTSLSINEILQPRYVNIFTNFRVLLLRVEIAPNLHLAYVFTRSARSSACLCLFSYLPTPPLGQDMTQGQFLSWVYWFKFKVFLLLD